MKKLIISTLVLGLGLVGLSSCESRKAADERYVEVVGEYEQTSPDAGYRLNLSYNGPLSMKRRFQDWADSLRQQYPSMVKMNENIFVNYMPEQMGNKMRDDMFQAGVSYILDVADTTAYNQITRDALKRQFPFNVNVSGTYMDPEQKAQAQKEMMGKAVANAKEKIEYLNQPDNRAFEIVSIEELEATPPYGHDYYDFNRRMIARVKVKARLQ